MGIQGLLPMLKSIERDVHLRDYEGMTLAIDGYAWLHKGAFSCAQDLCLGQPTDKYVNYFIKKINMFKFFKVKPYVVFDGGYLPSKGVTEEDRLHRREESLKQAMNLHKSGKKKEAQKQFQACVDVTPEMAFAVINALEAAGVDYVVAPYEADAQLAYLEKIGVVDGIVTEDSDLLVFGCKRVIFKLNDFAEGKEILYENLGRVNEFRNWTLTEIRQMCIFSGCDYLPSIPGVGIRTAHQLMRRFKSGLKVVKCYRMENPGSKVPKDYEEEFVRADMTFLYPRVYDPTTKSMVHLNPVPEELQDLVETEAYDFLGPALEQNTLIGVATGRLDPFSKEKLGHPHQPLGRPQHPTIVVKSPTKKPGNRLLYQDPHPRFGQDITNSKPIQAYFSAPKADSPRAHGAEKRERSGAIEDIAQKKRVIEVKSITMTKSECKSKQEITGNYSSKTASSHTSTTAAVVTEERSRFFGFESSEETTVAHKEIDSKREDSGIGLDEADLLFLCESQWEEDEEEPPKHETRKQATSKQSTAGPSKGAVSFNVSSTTIPQQQEPSQVGSAHNSLASSILGKEWFEKFKSREIRPGGLHRGHLSLPQSAKGPPRPFKSAADVVAKLNAPSSVSKAAPESLQPTTKSIPTAQLMNDKQSSCAPSPLSKSVPATAVPVTKATMPPSPLPATKTTRFTPLPLAQTKPVVPLPMTKRTPLTPVTNTSRFTPLPISQGKPSSEPSKTGSSGHTPPSSTAPVLSTRLNLDRFRNTSL